MPSSRSDPRPRAPHSQRDRGAFTIPPNLWCVTPKSLTRSLLITVGRSLHGRLPLLPQTRGRLLSQVPHRRKTSCGRHHHPRPQVDRNCFRPLLAVPVESACAALLGGDLVCVLRHGSVLSRHLLSSTLLMLTATKLSEWQST